MWKDDPVPRGKTTLFEEDLGRYDGDYYFLNVAVVPDPGGSGGVETPKNARGWCVTVNRTERFHRSNTNVVRIDDDHERHHGGRVHMDRLWLYPGERKRFLDATAGVDPPWGYEEARDHLRRWWGEYAYRYAHFREGPGDARSPDCPRTLAGHPLQNRGESDEQPPAAATE